MFRILAALTFFMMVTPAEAMPQKGLFANLTGTYWEFRDSALILSSGAGADYKDTHTEFGLKAGFLLEGGIHVGFSYLSSKYVYTVTGKQNQITETDTYDMKAYGPVLGFIYNNFFLEYSYFLSSEYNWNYVATTGTTNSSKYYDGSGYLIDAGYVFPITQTFSLGPRLSHWQSKYKKRDTAFNTGVDVAFEKGFTSIGLALFGGF